MIQEMRTSRMERRGERWEKGGEKGEERCARNHMATGMGDLPKGRSLEIQVNA